MRARVNRSAYYRGKYDESLANLPPPGGLRPCHPHTYAIAIYGVRAGLDGGRIFDDTMAALGASGRDLRLWGNDVLRSVAKAFQTQSPSRTEKGELNTRVPELEEREHQRIAKEFQGLLETLPDGDTADFWSRSCPYLSEDREMDGILVLETLYEPDDLLCLCRNRWSIEIRTRAEWVEDLLRNGNRYEFFCINPLSGKAHPQAGGCGMSRRCDAAVVRYRYALVEFDVLPIPRQLAFWSVARLPIAALTFSGGKSVHALIDLGSRVWDRESWRRVVKKELFADFLIPCGADGSTANPSRLSRMAGHLRADKGQIQELLYLRRRPKLDGIWEDWS
jgi:hypothetical protein